MVLRPKRSNATLEHRYRLLQGIVQQEKKEQSWECGRKACAYAPKWAHHIELRCFRILGSAHASDSTMAVCIATYSVYVSEISMIDDVELHDFV